MLFQENIQGQEIRTSPFWILCCKSQDPTGWFLKQHHLSSVICHHVWNQKVTSYGGRGLLKHHSWIDQNNATSCMHIQIFIFNKCKGLVWSVSSFYVAILIFILSPNFPVWVPFFVGILWIQNRPSLHYNSCVEFLPYCQSYSQYSKIKVNWLEQLKYSVFVVFLIWPIPVCAFSLSLCMYRWRQLGIFMSMQDGHLIFCAHVKSSGSIYTGGFTLITDVLR